jgi:hypothetical protein
LDRHRYLGGLDDLLLETLMRLILIAFTTPCVYMYLIGAGVSASFN